MRSVELIDQRMIPVDRGRPRRDSGRMQIGQRIAQGLVGAGVMVVFLILLVWLGSGGEMGGRGLLASSPDQLSYVEVTVSSGDSLWSLARRYGPENRDIRETVDRIRTINGLESRVSLRPGERLTIPTH